MLVGPFPASGHWLCLHFVWFVFFVVENHPVPFPAYRLGGSVIIAVRGNPLRPLRLAGLSRG